MQLITNYNPWGPDQSGGLATLNKNFALQDEQARQAKLDEINRRKSEQSLAMGQMEMEEAQNVRDIESRYAQEIKNIKSKGLGLIDEQKALSGVASQVDPVGKMKNIRDVTKDAMGAMGAELNMRASIAAQVLPMLKQGATPDEAAASPALQALATQYKMDPKQLAQIVSEFKPVAGNVVSSTSPDGKFMVLHQIGADGKVSTTVKELKAEPKEYLSRTRPEGRQLIFEESQDKGRTWKEVSRGDKDRPVSVTVGGRAPQEKTLSGSDIEKLEERRVPMEILSNLKQTYNPSFTPTGAKITLSSSVGDIQNKVLKAVGNNPAASAWWQDYFEWASAELKKRSGAAVTESEFKRFVKATIDSASSPTVVNSWLDRTLTRSESNYRSFADALGVKAPTTVRAYKAGAAPSGGKPAPSAKPGAAAKNNDPLGIR